MSSQVLEIAKLFKKINNNNDFVSKCKVLNEALNNFQKDIVLSLEDCKLLLTCLDSFLFKSIQLFAVKLFKAFDKQEGNVHELDRIDLLLSFASSIILNVFDIVSLSKDNSGQIYTPCIPSLIQLYLIFDKECDQFRQMEKVLVATLKIVQQPSLENFLNSLSHSTYTKTLKLFTSSLIKNEWKNIPAIVHAFKNFVHLSGRIKITESFSMMLPTVLLLVDDFETDHVVSGLQMMNKIFNETPAAELRMYAWDNVVYDAIQKKLYHRDAIMLDHCLPCLLLVLKVIERDPKKADRRRDLTRYDDVIQVLMSNLVMYSEKDIIRIHWKHFHDFIAVMGITVVRHLKELMKVFEHHLDIANFKHLPFIFQSIEVTIRVSWFRLNNHVPNLLKYLLKLALRLDLKDSNEDWIFKDIRKCVMLLHQCNPAIVQETAHKLNQLPEWNTKQLHRLTDISTVDCET